MLCTDNEEETEENKDKDETSYPCNSSTSLAAAHIGSAKQHCAAQPDICTARHLQCPTPSRNVGSAKLRSKDAIGDLGGNLKDKLEVGNGFSAILESYGVLGAQSGAWVSPGASTVCPEEWLLCTDDEEEMEENQENDDTRYPCDCDASFAAVFGSHAIPLSAGFAVDHAGDVTVKTWLEIFESYGALGAQSGAWTSSLASTTLSETCPTGECAKF
jgi:hypothetical protein